MADHSLHLALGIALAWQAYRPIYRKVGGLHWIFIGRLCFAVCWRKPC
jgi:hypothetical protein